ncbi:MAG: hypothetical protein P8Y70_16835 [Candidatus Lokiarchaeota archaeon]
MALELIDIIQGTFSLIFVVISLIVGITILLKYSQYKKVIYILVGLSWIGLANPWMPDSISFLMIMFGLAPLPDVLYFIIGNAFLPLFLVFWISALTELLYKNKQKLLILLFVALGIAFEIVFFSLLLIHPSYIGVINPEHPFTVDFGIFITLYLIAFIIILLVTGILFARNSLKSSNQEVKLKGRLLLAAFLLFTIGAILDSSIGMIFKLSNPVLPILVVITRVILMLSAISFYGGFILPKWMHRIFTRE